MASVVLLNDTSLFNSHFGCQLVGQTIREQLARVDLQLIGSFGLDFDQSQAKPYFEAADLLIVNGEGSIHNNRNLHLLEIARSYRSVLINCVFENNTQCDALKEFAYIAARESYSASAIRDFNIDCDVVPDVIFASRMLNSFPANRHAPIDLGITDNVTNPLCGFAPHVTLVGDYLSKLTKCRRLCAGRFHAAIAACVLKIPFSTWDSNTWKTRALMEDMQIPHLHFPSLQDAIANTPSSFDQRAEGFACEAIVRIEAMFDQIAEVARGK